MQIPLTKARFHVVEILVVLVINLLVPEHAVREHIVRVRARRYNKSVPEIRLAQEDTFVEHVIHVRYLRSQEPLREF